MIKPKAHHVHLPTNEQMWNWPRGIGCNRAPGRAHAALASCIFFACAARKLLAANLAFWVTSLGSPAAFLFVPLVAEAAEEPEEAGLAHRSLRDPAIASPAAGKILTKSLSKTLTLIAFPIWRPSWDSDTTTLKPSAGVVIACSLICSTFVSLRPRLVTQWPWARLHVRHGVTSYMNFMRSSLLSTSTIQGSVYGLWPAARSCL
mmetsp:Transcript_1525/g.3868  ORF Transcript_1525/g.3868 Transcript_1525/m.3868 type:complete len:204 (+) Transcript_1525:56-667(+)